MFCSAQIVLPQSGNVALLGGDNWLPASGPTNNRGNNDSNVFVTGTPQLQRGPDMNRPRWYATMTTMINGDVYVQGGRDGIDRPEIRSATTGSFRLLSGVNTTSLNWWYPRNFVAPDPPTAAAPLGRIFGIADRTMYYVNPAGNGSLNIVGNLASALPNGHTSSAVMFRPGKILLVGGGVQQHQYDGRQEHGRGD